MNRYNLSRFAVFLLMLFLLAGSGALLIDAQKKPGGKAKKLIAQAEKSFNQKDYAGAIDLYAQALNLSPFYPYAHFWKGYAHYYLDQFDPAIENLNKALEQGFTPLEIYKLRWYLYYQKKDYLAALSDAKNGLALDASNLNFITGIANIYRAQGAFREAIEAYRKVLELDPHNGDLNYFMALCFEKLGDTQSQIAAAEEAIRKNSRFIGESYFLAANAHQNIKDYDKAAAAYQRAINVKPDLYEAYTNLAEIYRRQNKMESAIDTTRQGLKTFPDDGNLYTSLSWFYSLADRHVEAIAAAQQAIKLLPNQYAGFTNFCRALNDTKQYAAAVQSCKKALELNPEDGESNFYIARAYDLLGQPEMATPFYKNAVLGLEKSVGKKPESSDGFYLLGNAYYADGQREKAIDSYRKSLLLSPNFAKARYNLGYLYFLNKDAKALEQQYEALLKIDADLAARLKEATEKK